jgi:hypothetical protein
MSAPLAYIFARADQRRPRPSPFSLTGGEGAAATSINNQEDSMSQCDDYTCDNCQKRERRPQPDGLPDGWIMLRHYEEGVTHACSAECALVWLHAHAEHGRDDEQDSAVPGA